MCYNMDNLPDMVVHIYNTRTREVIKEDQEFKASLECSLKPCLKC